VRATATVELTGDVAEYRQREIRPTTVDVG
jgi:hypothetical protein